MRLLYVFLGAGLLLQTACDHPIMGIFERHRASQEQQDKQQLRRRRAEIGDLVGQARCRSVEDCRFVGLGAKPCGGPWEFLIYSAAATDVERLLARVEEYNAFEARMNQRYGYFSDCGMPPEPELGSVENRCVDLRRQGDAVVAPPGPGDEGAEPRIGALRFVDAPEAVPEGDGYELVEAKIEDNLLILTVSYSGGCEPHEFALWALRPFEKSLPPRHQLFLRHRANGDLCEAYITRELRFDLNPFRRLHPEGGNVALVLEGVEEALEFAF